MPWTVTKERAEEIVRNLKPPTPEEDAKATRAIFGGEDNCPYIFRAPSPYAAVLVAMILKKAKRHHPDAAVGSGLVIKSLDHARAIASGDFTTEFDWHWEPENYKKPKVKFVYTRLFFPYRRANLTIAKQSGWEGEIPESIHISAIGAVNVNPGSGVLVDRPVSREPGPDTLGVTVYKFADGSYVCAQGQRLMPTRAILAPEKLTVAEIDAITDGDLRASAITRYAGPDTTASEGWLRYLRASNAEVIDQYKCDVTDTEEVLVRSTVKRDGQIETDLRLVCTCPTARMFVIGVPNEDNGKPIKTCNDAQRWLTGGPRVVART